MSGPWRESWQTLDLVPLLQRVNGGPAGRRVLRFWLRRVRRERRTLWIMEPESFITAEVLRTEGFEHVNGAIQRWCVSGGHDGTRYHFNGIKKASCSRRPLLSSGTSLSLYRLCARNALVILFISRTVRVFTKITSMMWICKTWTGDHHRAAFRLTYDL